MRSPKGLKQNTAIFAYELEAIDDQKFLGSGQKNKHKLISNVSKEQKPKQKV